MQYTPVSDIVALGSIPRAVHEGLLVYKVLLRHIFFSEYPSPVSRFTYALFHLLYFAHACRSCTSSWGFACLRVSSDWPQSIATIQYFGLLTFHLFSAD